MTVARHALWRAVRPGHFIPALLVLLFGFAEEVRASERFDGNWTISIFGTPGACQFGYRMKMTIDNGNVLYRGRQVSPHAIYVSNAGAVTLRSWVRVTHADLDEPLREAVVDWLERDWPFASVSTSRQ